MAGLSFSSWRAAVQAEVECEADAIWFPIGAVQRTPEGLVRLAFQPGLLRKGERSGHDVRLDDTLVDQPISESKTKRWVGRVVRVDRDLNEIIVRLDSEPDPAPRDGAKIIPPVYLRALLDWLDRNPGIDPSAVLARWRGAGLAQSPNRPLGPLPRKLRAAQRRAIEGTQRSFSVIWGPPGTGKTYTLARAIAAHVAAGRRVLALAPTRVAADGLALAIDEAVDEATLQRRHGDVLRTALPELYETFSQERPHLLVWSELEAELDCATREVRRGLRDLERRLRTSADRAALSDEYEALRQKDKALRAAYRQRQDELVSGAQVVVATVRQAVTRGWPGEFGQVAIDEAGMVSLSDSVYVLAEAREHVVLAGDPRQLGPITQAGGRRLDQQGATDAASASEDARFWLGQSLLDYLDEKDPKAAYRVLLDEQSRMNAMLCDVVSGLWYGGALRATPDAPAGGLSPHLHGGIHILDPSTPPGWLSPQMPAYTKQANVNRTTASWAASLARYLVSEGHSVVVMAPYRGQAGLYRRALGDLLAQGLRAGTVHAMQGQEADVAIYDPTYATHWWPRSSPEAEHITCVAASRARHCFVLVHGREYLEANRLLAPFVAAAGGPGASPSGRR